MSTFLYIYICLWMKERLDVIQLTRTNSLMTFNFPWKEEEHPRWKIVSLSWLSIHFRYRRPVLSACRTQWHEIYHITWWLVRRERRNQRRTLLDARWRNDFPEELPAASGMASRAEMTLVRSARAYSSKIQTDGEGSATTGG